LGGQFVSLIADVLTKAREFDESQVNRIPSGSPEGGRAFRPLL